MTALGSANRGVRDPGPSGWLAVPALVFFLAFGVLGLGVVLMLVMRAARPAFFRGWRSGTSEPVSGQRSV